MAWVKSRYSKNQKLILKNYDLCSSCIKRNPCGLRLKKKIISSHCFICGGLFNKINQVVDKILYIIKSNGYEYTSFSIGTSLPLNMFDREDHYRSILKVKGIENIKTSFNNLIRCEFKRRTKKKLILSKPDIMINVKILPTSKFSVDVISNNIYLFCRYNKKKMMPQRDTQMSVERIIKDNLLNYTNANDVLINWHGGEDDNSLVLGNGRAFSVNVINPRMRNIKKKSFQDNGISFRINEVSDSLNNKNTINFITKIKNYVETQAPIDPKNLKQINLLSNSIVQYRYKSKLIKKQVYTISTKLLDPFHFVVTCLCDKGLFIKQFVEGRDWIDPNLSSQISNECKCLKFDILDVFTS